MKGKYTIYVLDLITNQMMLFGIFKSWESANKKLGKVRKHYPNDNRFWIGIRFLNPLKFAGEI